MLTSSELYRYVADTSRRDLTGLAVGIVYGPMSEEDRVYIHGAPRDEWSLTALTDALRSRGALPVHLDPTDDDFLARVTDADVLLMNCHGPYGEDGRLQGTLDYLGVPYTCSGVLPSAVGMDKVVSKAVFTTLGVLTPRSLPLTDHEPASPDDLGFPVMLKAVDGGSSVGITLIHRQEELDRERVALEGRGFRRLFLEEYVPGRSVTISVLGTPDGPCALPALECAIDAPFYDESAKLGSGEAPQVDYRWPSDLPEQALTAMADGACTVFEFLQCRGAIRVDFLVDDSGQPWALEVNTVPGLQRKSNLPEAARLAGIGYEDLVAYLVLEAVDRREASTPPWHAGEEVYLGA